MKTWLLFYIIMLIGCVFAWNDIVTTLRNDGRVHATTHHKP